MRFLALCLVLASCPKAAPAPEAPPIASVDPPAAAPVSTPEVPAAPEPAAPDGKAVYERICVVCHQASGQGIRGAFPPLTAQACVDDGLYAARTVVNGRSGELVVGEDTYNGVMPPQGHLLEDTEVAAVVRYACETYAGTTVGLTEAQVAELRAQ